MYRVRDSVRSTHGQDGAIVLDIAQGKIYRLNRVGSRVLESLETSTSEAEIADRVTREFSVSHDIAEIARRGPRLVGPNQYPILDAGRRVSGIQLIDLVGRRNESRH